MPLSRPSLSTLLGLIATDIESALPGADALLRFANLRIMGKIFGGLVHLHYGYEDYIAKNSVPFTAEDEALQGWAAFKNVILKPATKASGSVLFSNCTPGEEIAGEIPLVRGDGVVYTLTSGGIVALDGTVTVSATASVAGAAGNCDAGVLMTLGIALPGIQSTGVVSVEFTGGADVESNDSLRSRMLTAFANPPQGGSAGDYVVWAEGVAGVTRAWCRPAGAGSGTVIVYFMMDFTQAVHGGFPQGTNGVATAEARAAAATGDQLAVANVIYPLEPVPALVYASAPTNNAINFTISGIAGASVDTKAAISAAIDDVFFRKGSPGAVYLPDGSVGGSIALSEFESAIASVANTTGFVLVAPAANITSAAGALPTRGTMTYV